MKSTLHNVPVNKCEKQWNVKNVLSKVNHISHMYFYFYNVDFDHNIYVIIYINIINIWRIRDKLMNVCINECKWEGGWMSEWMYVLMCE